MDSCPFFPLSLHYFYSSLPLSHFRALLPWSGLPHNREVSGYETSYTAAVPPPHRTMRKLEACISIGMNSFSFTSARVHRRKQVTNTAGGVLLEVVVLSKD